MIRILHLSDFHLNNRTFRDWNDYLKDSFFEKLDELGKENKIDLVVFTGDLVDKGGKDFKGASNGFAVFKEQIITPILEHLNLDISQFIICPGNHDIERDADDEIDEEGMKVVMTNNEKVINFINKAEEKSSYKRIKRIESYKSFEQELYDNVSVEKLQSIFKFSLKFRIGNKTVGISSLNSSWRCYDDTDYGNILLGENQLNENYKFIKECDVKIALVHHQLDWLNSVEASIINSHIHRNYDIILSGHVHEGDSKMSTGFTGSCFQNVAPSGLNQIRTDSKKYANGFTVIDYNDYIDCHYLVYSHEQKIFVDNTGLVDKGKKRFLKPSEESAIDLEIYRDAIENIIEEHYKEINNHFIKGKKNQDEVNVKSAFIYPPIDDGKGFYEKETQTSFVDIVNSKEHYLFLGPQESGKKSLLYRLIVEYVNDFDIYKKIPVFIDFNEIKNKEFLTIIKEYTGLRSKVVKKICQSGNFILMIDNLDFHESRNFDVQINRLHKFNKDFPDVRIIGTYQHENLGILPTEILFHSKITFSYQYIRGLRTKEIRKIMQQWLPSDDAQKNDESLEKLVKTFSSYHLPNNALSVHLYLWSIESSDKKPINQAVLMEIYIELILEKLHKENIYRNNFDFTNKIQLISMVAEEIIRKENKTDSLSYTEFHEIISKYLKEKVGFTFDENVIIEYLLDRKIFLKNKENEVKFSQVCFFHFFVAKRMEHNKAFKEFILDKERYFNYPKEIDYYTGLVRSDKETFNMIFERFLEVFAPMEFILENINPDEYFNIRVDKKTKEIEPEARNVEIAKIKESRPSDEDIEKQFDEQLNLISKHKSEHKDNEEIDFDRIMLIMCNVLRNSEGIEDLDLKKDAYNEIIKHNITYSILYTQLLIKYIIQYGKLPASIPPNVTLESLLKNFPYHIQQCLYAHLGTNKLSAVVLDKMKKDKSGNSNTNTETEEYLSVTLYSDIYGNNFDKYLREFVKSVNTVPVQNYLLYKLTEYLYKRSKSGTENEELYLDLISDLKIRSQKLPKRFKDRIVKDLVDGRKRMIKFIE